MKFKKIFTTALSVVMTWSLVGVVFAGDLNPSVLACDRAPVSGGGSLFTPPDDYLNIPDPFAGDLDPIDVQGSGVSTSATLAATTIPVYFHVITDALGIGNVPDALIMEQIRIMNDSFSGLSGGPGSNFQFALTDAGIDRTVNTAWFNMTAGSAEESAAKTALRKGDAKTLNVYTADSRWKGGRVSWATFPWNYKFNPSMDGVVLNFLHMPGTGLSLGDVAVHEAGHWLGLYHTFQGYWVNDQGVQSGSGCVDPGDYVTDTPAEDRPASGCPIGSDTCTSEGADPIHNFMDYSDDACQTEFTAGQVSRMEQKYIEYRTPALRPGKGRSRK
ncbi:MAG: zinc metalloprotease [Actinomycetota bacterium]